MYYFVNSQTMDRCGKKKQSTSVADPDPGSGAFLTPGSGIRNRFFPDPGSESFNQQSKKIRKYPDPDPDTNNRSQFYGSADPTLYQNITKSEHCSLAIHL
jgi:hypothetical protein